MWTTVPKFLHKYATSLRNAPITHITSFLLLHELTAIIPLAGLFLTFHYTSYLPPYFSEGKYIAEGVTKFGNYLRKKGVLGPNETISVDPETGEVVEGSLGKRVFERVRERVQKVDPETGEVVEGLGKKLFDRFQQRKEDVTEKVGERIQTKRAVWWGRGEGTVRIVVELATAWAVTKALLPARLVLSVWATPWFARVAVVPALRGFGRMLPAWGAKAKLTAVPPVATTGAQALRGVWKNGDVQKNVQDAMIKRNRGL